MRKKKIYNKNHGLNLELEKQHQDGTEWQFGAFSIPCITDIPLAERIKYLPHGEVQNLGEEKFNCVTRGLLNILKTKFDWLVLNNKLSVANHNWLQEKGYITPEGKVEFSDSFIAIKSGTTRAGNSMKAPADAIENCGLIPKTLMPQLMSFDDDYNPNRITPEIEALGLEFRKRFTINYDQVPSIQFAEVIKNDFPNVAGGAWPLPLSDGTYPANDIPFNHDFILWNLPPYYCFDNYPDSYDGDFIKKLAPDYKFMDYGYRIFISSENVVDETTTTETKPNWVLDIFSQLLSALKDLLTLDKQLINLPITSPNLPINTPNLPTETPKITLGTLAKSYIGKDASPLNKAPQAYACAESASNILHEYNSAFPNEILSTNDLFKSIKTCGLFTAILEPLPDCVIISPTIGSETGHVGFLIENQRIVSNDSATGLMQDNYSFQNWVTYFKGRNLHVYIFQPKK